LGTGKTEIWKLKIGESQIKVVINREALKKHISIRHPDAVLYWETLKENFTNPEAIYKSGNDFICVMRLKNREYKFLRWIIKKRSKHLFKKEFYLATFFPTDIPYKGNLIWRAEDWIEEK